MLSYCRSIPRRPECWGAGISACRDGAIQKVPRPGGLILDICAVSFCHPGEQCTTGQTTIVGDLTILAQALVFQPSSLSLYSSLSQKSTSILDPNASESGPSSRSILGYCPSSPRQPSPLEPPAGGRLQTVARGVLMLARVSSEGRSFS
jgi:hypothetical protein